MRTDFTCNCQMAQAPAISPATLSRSKLINKRLQKTVALYLTMVAVSTVAIFLLEHATLLNAFRTALVAAIGKTVAANWVTSFFD